MEDYPKYISIDSEIRFGKPCIKGTRIAVLDILQWLASGMSFDEILDDYPELDKDDLRACLLFAGKLVKVNSIQNVLAA